MKILLFALIFFAPLCAAQNGPAGVTLSEHAALLTWTASTVPSGTVTYNVYRTTGACPSTAPSSAGSLVPLNASPLAAATFTDTSSALITSSVYCWYIQAFNGTSGSTLAMAQGTIPFYVPPPVTNQAVAVQ
jgi:hypothetical protein